MKYSIFTVCTPEYAFAEATRQLSKWGYDGVEWRFHDRPTNVDARGGFWGGNLATIDQTNWKAEVGEVRKLCKAAGLAMPNLASYAAASDPKRYKPAIEAAAALGSPLVRVAVPSYNKTVAYPKLLKQAVADYRKVIAYAKKFKVKPVAEIHMGNIIPSAAAAAHFCSHFSPRDMGVIYDPGNMVYEGYEQYQMGLEMLGKYLAHVHIKNGRWEPAETTPEGAIKYKATWAPLKNGHVDFESLMSALMAVGYDGWLSLEDFSSLKKTEEKLVDDLKFLKAVEKRCRKAADKARKAKK